MEISKDASLSTSQIKSFDHNQFQIELDELKAEFIGIIDDELNQIKSQSLKNTSYVSNRSGQSALSGSVLSQPNQSIIDKWQREFEDWAVNNNGLKPG